MSAVHAEASKPQKKMQECNRCKAAGFPGQQIGFEKAGEDFSTGKAIWRLVNEDGTEHKHQVTARASFRRRRIVDIATVTTIEEAKKLLALGWDYQTSYPATLSQVPHYILVKRE
jgi:hypothetical protein